jgi:nitrogen regulatory protein PII
MDEMVMVVAHVRRTRRSSVGQALRQLELDGWTESDVVGHGHAAAGHGVEHVRFEVVLTTQRVQECCKAIAHAAETGTDGDGVVLTMPVLSVEWIGAAARKHSVALEK